MALVINVAFLFFLAYLCFALCVKQTGMQAGEDFSLTCSHCQLTTEARKISKQGKPHVHCPCEPCPHYGHSGTIPYYYLVTVSYWHILVGLVRSAIIHITMM